MKFTKIAVSMLCSMILLCGCVKNNDIVLKINDAEVTKSEFYDGLDKIINIQLKNAPKDMKKKNGYAELIIKDKYTNDFIARKLLEQEYQKRNIEATPDEIGKKKKEIIAQIGSEEKLKEILRENNISEERANEDFANEVKIQKLINILSPNGATDADAEKFYKNNKAQFTVPESVRVSHILFDTNPESIKRKMTDGNKNGKLSSEEIENKVKEEIIKKENLAKEIQQKAVKNPKDFAKLATQYSDDVVSAKQGGELGYITKNQVVKEFSNAAFNQKVGTISPLVKSEFGLHIIYVKDKSAGGVQPYAAVKAELKNYLTEQKKMETIQKYVENLKRNATIEFVDESLKPENIRKQIEEAIPKQVKPENEQTPTKIKLESTDEKK